MLNGRKSLVTVISTAAIVATLGAIPGGSAQAKPSIDDVQHRVDRLYHAAEQASEHYNQIHVQLTQMRGDVSALRADQSRQQSRTEKARRVVADSIVQQYEGDSLSAVGQAVVSSDPQRLRLPAEHAVAVQHHAGGSVLQLPHRRPRRCSIRQDATSVQLAKVARLEKQAAQDKAAIAHNLSEAKSVLDKMKADARARLVEASRGATTRISTANIPVSGRAAAAVHFAMAQIGKPYVYGAAGPSAYDCSGLTMAAWGAQGSVSPHSSAAQYGSGHPHLGQPAAAR